MNTFRWIAILFGISIMFYLMGYQPLLFSIMDKYSSLDYTSIPGLIGELLTNWDSILLITGASVATGFLLGGVTLQVVLLFALAGFLINVMVLPTSYIADGSIPEPYSFLLTVFFSFSTYLVLLHFVSGRVE